MENAVVVGAGLAGLNTVKSLRAKGFDGALTLIGNERHRPYDRPPLTKQLLAGKLDATPLPAEWDDLDVTLLPGVSATGLTDGILSTTDGEHSYDHLVIATGARPRTLPAADGAPVHTVRTLDDALRLRAELTPGARVVIVGAGWIGAETAGTAAELGCQVDVLEAAPTVLPSCGFGELAARFEPWYADAGIRLHLNAKVAGIGTGAVTLADGTTIPADVVVVGIGVVPATEWLTGGPIELGPRGAVPVDAHLRSTLPNVYATGDCSAYESRRYGGPVLLEHWTHAQSSPGVIATNILGGDAEYDDVPYFWSRQFGRMVQYLGRHRDGDTVVPRGEPADGKWSVCWVRDGEVTAVLAVGRPRELVDARALLARPHRVDTARLADPDTKLTDCG